MTRIEELKSFLRDDPHDHFSTYALALEYIKINRAAEAISLLEKLIRLNPDYLAAYYQLGKLFESAHDFPKASFFYQAGIEVARKKKDQKTLNELRTALDLLEE